jgi:hypothetical protein
MTNSNQWPLWLQLLIGIPNAIVMTILVVIWWPDNKSELKRFRAVAYPYIILVILFYFLFVRQRGVAVR